MRARDQLLNLFRIQQLANEIRKAQRVLHEAPRQIEEIEQRFRERNAEYVAVRDRYDELEQDQSSRSSELSTLEESRKKFMDDLMQVKNQREYAAMLKEIDAVKAQIADHEEGDPASTWKRSKSSRVSSKTHAGAHRQQEREAGRPVDRSRRRGSQAVNGRAR